MPLQYTLAPNPFWTIFDLVGKPLGGGFIYTFSSKNPGVQKPVYMTADNSTPWTNPINVPLNGQVGPIFWQVNTDDNTDNYFVIVTDSNGNTVWEIDEFNATTGSGGGGTTVSNVNNLAINPFFWRANIDTPIVNPRITNPPTILCPGAHAGFGFNGDHQFFESNNTSANTITYKKFALGDNTFSASNDITPELFCNVKCTTAGTASKYYAIPINLHLKSLENQVVTASIWAQGVSGNKTIGVSFLQYTGSGSNVISASVSTVIIPDKSLGLTWTRYSSTATIPSAGALTLGNNGNDANFLLITFPTASNCEINFAKPTLYLGNNIAAEFLLYDQVESIIESARTGDIRKSINGFTPFGWIPMNDGTIANGDPGNVAPAGGFARNNIDTWPLFQLLWNINTNDGLATAYAPIYTSAGVLTTRGGTADADFAAKKQIRVLYALGAVLGNTGLPNVTSIYTNRSGTNWALGQPAGGEIMLAQHNHVATRNMFVENTGSGGGGVYTPGNTGFTDATTGNVSSGVTSITNPPTLRVNYFMKL